MAFRRHSKTGSRNKKMPVQWITDLASWGGSGAALVANTATLFNLADTAPLVLAAGVQVSRIQDVAKARVEAIRGSITLNNSSTTNQRNVFVGVIVTDLYQGAAPAAQLNPANILDSQKSWMFLKQVFLDIRAASGNSSQSTIQLDVHVKSRRLLHAEQQLQLVITDVPLSGSAAEVFAYPFLRTLITRLV